MKKIATLLAILFVVIVLTSCGKSKWNIEVSISPEERQAIKEEIVSLKETIKNYEGPIGTIPFLDIISLAKEYENLGDMKSAIDTYKSYLDGEHKTRSMIHNLGRLYEKVGEYDLAIEQYKRMVDEYVDNDYLHDITWAYIRAKDRKNAEKHFNAWQLGFNKTDEQTQQAIKDLREEEKAN